METAVYEAKTAFIPTVVAMNEANNAAKMMDNQREEINLRYQQQNDFLRSTKGTWYCFC